MANTGNNSPDKPGEQLNGVGQAAQDRPLVSIPDHKLLRRIGQGSYGEVWLAQTMMGLFRAVKIVYRESFKDDRPFEREISGIRQFEPVSRSHDGFVDVLHVGIDDARHCFYYVMELGDDQLSGQAIDPEHYIPKTLASEISRAGHLTLQEVVKLGIALTGTLAELHKRGLVHRDIKPSNIIYVNGTPKLADIGLVAEANAALSYVGTAGFIAPEGPGTAKADIYSLGKVLYEASTGKDRQDFPEVPSLWEISPDQEGLLELNEVILRSCKFDAAGRYASAEEMQAELVIVANGKSVKRLRLLEQRWRAFKHVLGLAALVLVAAALLFREIYGRWQTALTRHQQQVGANLAYANRAVEAGDLLGALPYLAEVLKLEEGNREAEATHRLRMGSTLSQCPKLTQLWFESKHVNSTQFSPDGRRILTAELFGQARIYDVVSGQLCFHPFGPGEGLSAAAYSPDGRFIVTASQDDTASIWNAENLEQVHRLAHPNRVYNADFSPQSDRVITCCKDGKARVWDLRTGQQILDLPGHSEPVMCAKFSHNGLTIATAGQDGTARLWDAKEGRPLGPPLFHGKWVTCVSFSPDDQKLITTSDDRRARVWETSTSRRISPDLVHRDMVTSAAFSPDGKLIVTASLDGMVRLWNSATLEPLTHNPILRHGERVNAATFSPDGHCIVTCCADGSVRVWDLAGATVPPLAERRTYCPDASAFLVVTTNHFQVLDALTGNPVSPKIELTLPEAAPQLTRTGKFAFRLQPPRNLDATNYEAQVWEANKGHEVITRFTLPKLFTGASVSDDGRRLIAYGGKFAQLWDIPASSAKTKPLEHDAPVKYAVFSRDGKRAATSSGNKVYLWDENIGAALPPPLEHPALVSYMEFSPDSRLLVCACMDFQYTKCSAQIWNPLDGKPGPALPHRDGVLYASFSPDGARLVTASEDSTARVWDTATGKPLSPAMLHNAKVLTAAFSPDGKRIVTASADASARVWSADTGEPLTPPFLHPASVYGASFLPGGHSIVTIDNSGQAWVWTLPVESRPAADVIKLAQLLADGSNDALDLPKATEPAEQTWRRLRNDYGAALTTFPSEVAAWHELQARESELTGDWFATAFHLRRLATLHPGDPLLAGRLARANEHLQKAQ